MEQSKKKTGYFAWLLLLAAMFPLVFGGYPLVKQIALDTIGVKTTGIVIDVVGYRTKAPVVRFTTADGREIEFKSGLATNFISFSRGEEVEVRYLSAVPRIAEVTALGRISYLTDIGTTCLGGLLLLGALVALRSKPLVLDFSRRKG